jgi:gliding motility-associated-like protein
MNFQFPVMFYSIGPPEMNPRLIFVKSTDFRAVLLVVFLILPPCLVHAQLCQGSLGDPIVNLDFGSGTTTHGSALPAGTTSYTWSTKDFPIDGSYTIENSTAGSGSQWWSATDHTGNSGGYMMVVNASLSLTDYFYKKTITGLCPGTLYEFAAWVMNLLSSQDLSPPDITFIIEQTDGTVINSYNTGSIALQSGPVWRQFGFYFTTPATVTSVVVVMKNNSAGGAPANDIALDDITFRPCGPEVSASISESAGETDTICVNSNLTLNFQGTVSAGYSNPQYQWQELINGIWQDIPGATSLDAVMPTENYVAGSYFFRLSVGESANFTSQQCRVVSNRITLVVEPRPVAEYNILSALVCANQGVQFTDSSQSTRPVTYSWDFGDGGVSSEKNPSHLYSQSGTYHTSLIITSPEGCADTATLSVPIELLPVPTAKFHVTPDDTTIFHPAVTFIDESSGGLDCLIDWGDGTVTDCSSTVHDYTTPGTYIVKEIVENAEGCRDTAFTKVIIRAEFRFFIPDAFTPNNDGLNDVFKPALFGVHGYVFLVFNRWGQELFVAHDSAEGWNGYYKGNLCPPGIYIYKITFHDDVANQYRVYSDTFALVK